MVPLKQSKMRRRREGFEGETILVLPAPLVSRLKKDRLHRDFHITAAGSFPAARGHLVERKTGSPDAIVVRVLAGSGWVRSINRRALGAGDVFVLQPKVFHSYGAADEDPWTIEWAHFSGSGAVAMTRRLSAGEPIRIFHAPDYSLACIRQTLSLGYTPLHLLRAANHLRHFLTEAPESHRDPEAPDYRIHRSIRWMRDHIAERPSLQTLSREAGLSVPHYCSLFRRHTGSSPLHHFRRLNIQHACQLLDTSDLRIGEVAHRLGWGDPFHFSRCFHRITGKSPTAWRRSGLQQSPNLSESRI